MPPREEWKEIAGTGGLYEISSHGRVRSVDRVTPHRYGRQTKRGRILEPVTRRHGEMLKPDKHFVKLTLSGRSRQVRPARLVAEHFPSASAERRIGLPAIGEPYIGKAHRQRSMRMNVTPGRDRVQMVEGAQSTSMK